MATDFSTALPTAVPQPAPYQHHAYRKSANYSTMGSGTNTPMNVSPTSPRSTSHMPTHPHHAQIRPMKAPIYVPAALRRTQKPGRQSPPKVDSALDSPNSSWGSGTGVGQSAGEGSIPSVSRINTSDLHSIYDDTPLSPIAGPITRNHWQPDGSTPECTASACQTQFGFFNRRHHCRKCGAIFCWQHSQKHVRLNEQALFHPEGEWHRACDRCHSQYREWEQMRSSRANSESSGSSTAAVTIDTPVMAKRPEAQRVGSLATSLQNAWNWSTF